MQTCLSQHLVNLVCVGNHPVTLMVVKPQWGCFVDLLSHMNIYTSVLTILKGREPLPAMVYSIYVEWDTLLSLLLYTLAHSE